MRSVRVKVDGYVCVCVKYEQSGKRRREGGERDKMIKCTKLNCEIDSV